MENDATTDPPPSGTPQSLATRTMSGTGHPAVTENCPPSDVSTGASRVGWQSAPRDPLTDETVELDGGAAAATIKVTPTTRLVPSENTSVSAPR